MWWFIALVVAGGIWYWWSQATKPPAHMQAPVEPPKPAEPKNNWISQMAKQAAAESDAKIARELSDIQAAAKRHQNRQ